MWGKNMLKRSEKQLMGARSRKSGRDWERTVQKRYEQNSYIVARWTKKPVLDEFGVMRLQDAKSNKFRLQTCGFPDYVCIKGNKILFVECKSKNYLTLEERRMKAYYEGLGYDFVVEVKESVRSKKDIGGD